MPSATPPPKTCVRCGIDCSGRPRTKDAQGRYTCRDCLDRAQTKAQAAGPRPAGPVLATAPGLARAPAPGPATATARADEDAAFYLLEEDAAGGADINALLAGAVGEQASAAVAPCPGCGNPLRAGTAVCVNCGFNTRTGKALSTREGKAVEAKAPLSERARGRQRDREMAKAAAQLEYVKPVVMIVGGLGLTTTLLGSMEDGDIGLVIGYLILFAISVTLTIGAYMFCALTWLGSDAPFPIVVLRLVGICAVMDILLVGVFARMPMGFGLGGISFRFILPLLIYAMFLQHLMEIDWEEALMVGVITGVVKVVGTIAIWYWLVTAFGS